ncbi:MAG: SIP domain-containing protein [Flavipsychrobacter sp.]|nr:SIP domain-containing protein [Flavipsychrobacter sp.]
MNIKDKTIGLLERRITKTALVLATRSWAANSFYEVDLHVPDADFDRPGVKYMKCRVNQLTYRDYTIAMWDVETKTCTLFVDAAHSGPGSEWVKNLKKNDVMSYLNVESHRYNNPDNKKLLMLGDQSSVGHFLALQQLAEPGAHIEGAIVITRAAHRTEFNAYYPDLNLHTLSAEDGSTQALARWLEYHGIDNDMVFLAGNVHMVTALRQQLRVMGYSSKQIDAQGFWR